jgi:hypothetical protein
VAVNVSAAKPVFNEIDFIDFLSLKLPSLFTFSHISEIRMKLWILTCQPILLCRRLNKA